MCKIIKRFKMLCRCSVFSKIRLRNNFVIDYSKFKTNLDFSFLYLSTGCKDISRIRNCFAPRHSLRLSFTPEKLAGLNQILMKRRVFSPEDIRNIATYFKLQESKCRIWFKENGARLRRQACSVRILPDTKKNSSDRRKSYVLKVRKRTTVAKQTSSGKGEKQTKFFHRKSSSMKADSNKISNVEKKKPNANGPSIDVDAVTSTAKSKSDEYVEGVKITFCRKKISNDINVENNATLLKPAEIKREPADANSSSSDESKNVLSGYGDSNVLSTGLGMNRNKDKFFYELPYDKRVLLLKLTENLTTASSADAQKLAKELDVPFKSVYSWLKSKSIRNFRTWNKRLSRDKTAVLDDEFAVTPDALTEERALMLSYELDLSVSTIRKYFERKKTELKPEDKQNCSVAARVTQNIGEHKDVFEALNVGKTEEHISSNCNNTIENENLIHPLIIVPPYVPSGLQPSECSNSSSKICLRPRTSLNDSKNQSRSSSTQSSSGNERDMMKKRRFVLTLRQKKLLMEQFQKTPFITPTGASLLATKLGLPVKAIQLWFHRKRLEKNKNVSSEMKECSAEHETDNQPPGEVLNV